MARFSHNRPSRRLFDTAIRATAGVMLGLLAGPALSQETIVNGGFETDPPARFGNNIGHSIAPWQTGSGGAPNVVKVDGPGGFNYKRRGPQVDASNGGVGAGAGAEQHYLDSAYRGNEFFQSFTVPNCSAGTGARYDLSAWFSARDNQRNVSSYFELREGAGLAGPTVTGSRVDVIIPGGDSRNDPWQEGATSVTLDYGQTYSFVIALENAANVDEASVFLAGADCAPVTLDDTRLDVPAGQSVTIDVLANDEDIDGDIDRTRVALTPPAAATGIYSDGDGDVLGFSVPGEGAWSVDGPTGAVTFTPDAWFSGFPTPVGYTVRDARGQLSNLSAKVTIGYSGTPTGSDSVLKAVNDGPIFLDGHSGESAAASVLANDTFRGAVISDPSLVSLSVMSWPSVASGAISVAQNGMVSVAPGTAPGTYTLVYQICAATAPARCATAKIDIVVLAAPLDLPSEIEEDLTTILEEDLANTLTMQSRQISGYSADALNRLRQRTPARCLADLKAHLSDTTVLFDTDKAVLKPEASRTLDAIAGILGSCPGTPFEIAGHTDSDASDAYNLDLSQRRVTAILGALAQRGVDTSGFTARGYGESRPIASNATEAGKARNRRVEFRPLDAGPQDAGPQDARQCDNRSSLARALDIEADDDGTTADGQVHWERHDCVTDRREVFEGAISHIDTDQGQTQTSVTLSYRRERYRGSDSVFGYFVGLYGSRSDVDGLADGDIDGYGVNAGIYGARRLNRDLFLDYYLGAAAGRHDFDLDFDRSMGTISADGDYRYIAGFAGAALSGELSYGHTTVAPRIGFDYVYAPDTDVDYLAELDVLSQVGDLELEAISGGRVFAEVRTDYLLEAYEANLWVVPRVACYQSLGSLDGVCGFGGTIGIESAGDNRDLVYALEVDGEWGDDYGLGALSFRVERALGAGALRGDLRMGTAGPVEIAGGYEVRF